MTVEEFLKDRVGPKSESEQDDTSDASIESTGNALSIGALLQRPAIFKPQPRITTGHPELDKALGGGFVRGSMNLLAGPTGRGKSTFIRQVGVNIAKHNIPTLLLTYEDTIERAVQLAVASETSLAVAMVEDYDRLEQQGREHTKQMIDEAKSRLEKLPLYLADEPNDLPSLLRYIRKLHKQNGLEVVLVDQTSWVSSPGGGKVFEEASMLSRGLKKLARELGIVICALVQVNREGSSAKAEGKRLQLFHLRDSGRFEQDADCVLMIQNVDTEANPALLTLDVMKNRHGRRDVSIDFAWKLPCANMVALGSKPIAQEPARRSRSKPGLREFIENHVPTAPTPRENIITKAVQAGFARSNALALLKGGVALEYILETIRPGNQPRLYQADFTAMNNAMLAAFARTGDAENANRTA